MVSKRFPGDPCECTYMSCKDCGYFDVESGYCKHPDCSSDSDLFCFIK